MASTQEKRARKLIVDQPAGKGRPLTKEQCEAAFQFVEALVAEGFNWRGLPGAVPEAARRLGLNPGTFSNIIRRAAAEYGLKAPAEAEAPPLDPVVERRLRDQLSAVKLDLENTRRELADAREFRGSILGVAEQPIRPSSLNIKRTKEGKHLAEAAILDISDVHYNEYIDLDEMGGLNSYDTKIAEARLVRCFEATIDLMTRHWSGPPPAKLVVLLAGDMFSGDIHEELTDTNDGALPVAVTEFLAILVRCFNLLLGELECPIEVVSVPGNHSRTTRKPRMKRYAATNFDSLVSDLLEWHYKSVLKEEQITFARSDSIDALFRVFDWRFLCVHGDAIGSGGGQGFIGPAATIARGMKKIVDEYAASRVFIDAILVHHFHTPLMLEYGYANGCVCGPNQFSAKKLRARPSPATQNFLTVHPIRGITQYRQIQVGHPSEGSLYSKVPA